MTESDVEYREKPDPEVKPPTRRRQFSEAEKRRILDEADACTERGEIGALLRREGIYASYLTRWRRQRARGELNGKPRGPQPKSGPAQELEKLRRENARLRTRLEQVETIIEVQKNSLRCLDWRPRRRGASQTNDRYRGSFGGDHRRSRGVSRVGRAAA